jgi:signal transduction histidine kinase
VTDSPQNAVRWEGGAKVSRRGRLESPCAQVGGIGVPVAVPSREAWAESPPEGHPERSEATTVGASSATIAYLDGASRADDDQRLQLALDLHDGPLQDIAFLTADVRLFRAQLCQMVGATEGHHQMLGRIDDLEAQLVGVAAALRRLASPPPSANVSDELFRDALDVKLTAFQEESGIRTDLFVEGSLSSLSSGQRVALLRIIREALSNIRKHASANQATIRIAGAEGAVHTTIEDDGRGFDVGEALAHAARTGSLGLTGMATRARLAGGQCRFDSEPGRATTIHVLFAGANGVGATSHTPS